MPIMVLLTMSRARHVFTATVHLRIKTCQKRHPHRFFSCWQQSFLNRRLSDSHTVNPIMCRGQRTVSDCLLPPGDGYRLSDCLTKMISLLQDAGVPDSESSAQCIIAHCLGHKTLYGLDPKLMIDSRTEDKIQHLIDRRMTRVPTQYVIGEWDFRNLTLTCRPPVFIPRPETEELVSLVMADPVVQSAESFLEVGPGTGALSLALLQELPKLCGTAIDLSEEACALTEHNAKRHSIGSDKITVINGTFGPDTTREDLGSKEGFDFMISNPPYIPTADMSVLDPEIVRHEDDRTLHGGDLGLNVIRHIHQRAASLVKTGGSVWLETDSSHPHQIREMSKNMPENGLRFIQSYKDFCSRWRFVHLKVMNG